MYIPSTTPLPTQTYLDEDLNRTDNRSKKKPEKRRKSKAKYEVEPNSHESLRTDFTQPTYIYAVGSNQEEYIDSYDEGQSRWGQIMLNSVSMIRPLLIGSAFGILISRMLWRPLIVVSTCFLSYHTPKWLITRVNDALLKRIVKNKNNVRLIFPQVWNFESSMHTEYQKLIQVIAITIFITIPPVDPIISTKSRQFNKNRLQLNRLLK